MDSENVAGSFSGGSSSRVSGTKRSMEDQVPDNAASVNAADATLSSHGSEHANKRLKAETEMSSEDTKDGDNANGDGDNDTNEQGAESTFNGNVQEIANGDKVKGIGDKKTSVQNPSDSKDLEKRKQRQKQRDRRQKHAEQSVVLAIESARQYRELLSRDGSRQLLQNFYDRAAAKYESQPTKTNKARMERELKELENYDRVNYT